MLKQALGVNNQWASSESVVDFQLIRMLFLSFLKSMLMGFYRSWMLDVYFGNFFTWRLFSYPHLAISCRNFSCYIQLNGIIFPCVRFVLKFMCSRQQLGQISGCGFPCFSRHGKQWFVDYAKTGYYRDSSGSDGSLPGS